MRVFVLPTFTDNVKKTIPCNKLLKFDKLFILHSWINESLKINFEQRKKCSDTVKFLKEAIFFKISKPFCYNLVKKWGLQYKLKILGLFSIIHVTTATTQTSFLFLWMSCHKFISCHLSQIWTLYLKRVLLNNLIKGNDPQPTCIKLYSAIL